MNLICSKTRVYEFHLFKNFIFSRTTVQELHRFMNLSSRSSRTVLELICSRTSVYELHLFKNNSLRTSSVQELQFKNFTCSRTTVQELHRFMNLKKAKVQELFLNSSRTNDIQFLNFFRSGPGGGGGIACLVLMPKVSL